MSAEAVSGLEVAIRDLTKQSITTSNDDTKNMFSGSEVKKTNTRQEETERSSIETAYAPGTEKKKRKRKKVSESRDSYDASSEREKLEVKFLLFVFFALKS